MRRSAGIVAQVDQRVLRSGLLREGESLLLAVSGGQDSVAMLLALADLRERLVLSLTVGHVNHGLRGQESDQDEQFVRDLAQRLALPLMVEPVRVRRKTGVEEAARDARLAALQKMRQAVGAERIALAHTADDRAETLMMNLLRGSGLEGLAAMPAASGDLVRPLLGLSREQTLAYCEAKGIAPRQDSTNLDESLLRNRLRLSLLPLLEREYQPNAREALVRLGEIAEAELEWTLPLVREAFGSLAERGKGTLALHLAGMRSLASGLRQRVLREAVAEVRGGLRDVTLEHLQALDHLIVKARAGARADLPGLWAERTSEALVLRPGPRVEATGFEVSLRIPGEAQVAPAGLAVTARLRPVAECDPATRGPLHAHLDAAVTGRTLLLRSPRAGDRIAPLGMSGTKKLQDFLVDKKIPRADREGISVVATTKGEVVWIVGHRISERAKVTERTRQVAELIARRLA